MNKKLWMCAMVATALAACSQDEMVPVVTDNDFEGPDGRVVIQLGGVDHTAAAQSGVTRTPLEKLHNGTSATTQMGVFALATADNKGVATDNATAWADVPNCGILLNNVKAEATATVSGEGWEATATNKITLYNSDGSASGQVYYYPMQQRYSYSFYAYAPYQEGQTVKADDTKVEFTIDGSQDIIYASKKAADITASSIWTADGVKNTEPLYGYNAKYIRSLKYHADLNKTASDPKLENYPWVPNLNFEHKLAQLRFIVEAAKNQSSGDRTSAQSLKVQNIYLKNMNTKATLDILNGEMTFDTPQDLILRKVTAGNTYEDAAYASTDKIDVKENNTDVVAGYLMVEPNLTSLEMYVTLVVQDGGSGIPQEQQVKINIDAPDPKAGLGFDEKKFYAGCYYNIRIGVYAMQKIEATASLVDWKEGSADIEAPVE